MNIVVNKIAVNSPAIGVVSSDEAVLKELVLSVDKMILAISSNQSVQIMANNLAEKNWWGAFKGNLSGANDKDIASMVKNLGGSLETTQAVVQVMLRLQTQKVQNLRGFHSMLVDKIIKIQADTKTLDVNQRTVALDIVSALQDQIEDQLHHYDAVERHELQLQEIDKTLISSEENFREYLKVLDAQCASLKKSDDYLSCEVEEFQVGLKVLAAKSAVDRIEAVSQACAIQENIRSLEVKRVEDINSIAAVQERLRNDIVFLSQGLKSATKALQVSLKELATKSEADLGEVEIQNRLIQTELRSLEVKRVEGVNSIAAVQEKLRNDIVFLGQGLTSATKDIQVSLKELATKSEADLGEVEIQTRLIQTELRSLEVKRVEDVNSIAAVQEKLRNDIVFLGQGLTSATGALSGHINHQIALMANFEARLTRIESEFVRGSTWSARLLRHSFGLVGILIGIAGLAISLYRS